MKNLFSTLIPYKKIALLVLLLMAGQAYCEMNLPMYTQNLIDTGIQNRGVEHILPEAATSGDLMELKEYMSDLQFDELSLLYTSDDGKNTLSDGSTDPGAVLKRIDLEKDALAYYDEYFIEPVVKCYAAGRGEMIPDQIDAEDRNVKAMGIQFAADCDEAAGLDMLEIQNRYMWHCGGLMLLMSLIVLVFTTGISFLAARVGANIGRDLRSGLFRNVMSFSSAEISKFQTSSLITRATNDIQQVQMTCTMILRMMLFAPCICIWSMIKVYQTHAHLNYIVVVGVIAILLMVFTLFKVSMPKFKIMQTLIDDLNAVSREIITGIQVIRAFGREKTEEKRFDRANKNLYHNQLFVNRTMISMSPFLMIIMYGLTVWITWASAEKIDLGELQVGTMTAFIAYSMEIVFSFLMIASMAIFLPRAGVAADRIFDVLNTESSITDRYGADALPEDADSTVRFENVSFKYPDAEENVLSDIDFTAKPGETTAIIGSTGCGKTTLVSLIPRFFDVTSGRITIGGKDIRDITLKSLRDEIGYIPQKGILFSGTISENIRWGNEDADPEEVREAAEIAQAEDFIDEKPEGFDSEISQGGANVSGGQKQRLAIARAIIKKPAIMIFDDSFSALDMKTDIALRRALAEKTADSTRIIVAQRVGTILHAEQIIVLDEGRIVGKGTHSELMKSCEIYRDIARSQLSEEELEVAGA